MHRRFKEQLCVLVNTSGHHEIKLVAIGKAKNYYCLRALKQKAFLFIIEARKE
jgi:hypothetical protein